MGHKDIIMRMEISWNNNRAVTRDINGFIFVWDLVAASSITRDKNNNSIIQKIRPNGEAHENVATENFIVRKITSTSKTVTCIALDDRQLVMGSIGHLNVFDYWNSVAAQNLILASEVVNSNDKT